MKMQKLENATIICRGGLDSNRNWLELSAKKPGSAANLVNFEPSLFGGYRRINGFSKLEETDSGEVDPTGAEGQILGVFVYDDKIIAARKQQSGNTYEFYLYVSGSAWSKYTTGLTLSSVGVNRIRYATFNFDGTEKVIFTDGVNKAVLFDGTNWSQIDPAGTGADFANAGGAQALSAPHYVKVFRNHIFMAHCTAGCQIVAYSAPRAEYDWTSASGAGQINAGLDITQIHPFRDELFVFGERRIKKIVVDGTDFTLQDVSTNIGCIAPDSVLEINGDLIFISEDGIRPVKATERINDIEIGNISKVIQQDIRELNNLNDPNNILGVVVANKSQFRYFYSSSSTEEAATQGIIGGLQYSEGDVGWEFGKLLGIRPSCITSGRYGSPKNEVIIHGTFDGKVMQQESGNSFDGSGITAIYETPYLDMGYPLVRKTMHEVTIFSRPEGALQLNVALTYDWGNTGKINPSTYTASSADSGSTAVYGTAVYGTDVYGDTTFPAVVTGVEGSGYSVKFGLSTTGTEQSYSIQGIILKYDLNGYK